MSAPPKTGAPPPTTARTSRRLSTNGTAGAYVMLSPVLVLLGIFSFLPLAWNIVLSMFSGGFLGGRDFVGVGNYVRAFQNPSFVQALTNTGLYAVVVIPGSIIVALIVALLINEVPWLRGFFRGSVYLPVLASSIVVANIWAYVANRDAGLLNYLLGSLGLPRPDWLGDAWLAMPTIAGEEIWRGFGYYVLIFSAALSAVPSEIYEAARLDGATGSRILFKITIPMIAPAIGFSLVMATIWALQVFDVIFVLTKGGPAGATTSISWYIYQQAFAFNDVGLASTMSVILFAATIPIAMIQLRAFRQQFEA